MKIRDAILAAADHIERNPQTFNFAAVRVPHRQDCDTPGCAIGWIAHFSEVKEPICILDFARDVLGVGDGGTNHVGHPFYRRMDSVHGSGKWTISAPECAAALRKYADKYHPAEQRDLIPASVREIFSHEYTARDLVP